MPAMHVTNTLNVEATLYAWLVDQLNDLTLPAWLPSYAVVNDVPEKSASFPVFSLLFIPVSARKQWQGNHVGGGLSGTRNAGLMDVSAWVTRGSQNHAAQLRTMRAMIEQVFAEARTVVIQNYLSDPANPVATTYKIDIQDCEFMTTAPDANPDIERARYLIRYDWTQRSN